MAKMTKKEYLDKGRDKASKVKAGANPMSRKLASFWKDQIEEVDGANAAWYKRGDMIIKR